MEHPKPYQLFDTGCDFVQCFFWVHFSPFHAIRRTCYELLRFPQILIKYIYIQGSWEVLLHAGCCLVVVSDFIVFFEQWLSSLVNMYGTAFALVEFVSNFFPSFDCGGNLPRLWDHIVAQGQLGLPQLRYQKVFPPACTSGRHGHVHLD